MSHRREQLASVLHRAIQHVLTRGLNDPRIRGLVTVTEVEVTGDHREAVVHVSILPAEYQAATFQGLNAATLRLQKMVNDQLDVRRPPHIRFHLDERIKKQAQVLAAIREAVGPDPADAPDGPSDPHREFTQADDAENHPETDRRADDGGANPA